MDKNEFESYMEEYKEKYGKYFEYHEIWMDDLCCTVFALSIPDSEIIEMLQNSGCNVLYYQEQIALVKF